MEIDLISSETQNNKLSELNKISWFDKRRNVARTNLENIFLQCVWHENKKNLI